MLYNSLQYLFFFSIITAIYFRIPHRYRWALLLAASYYFYLSWKIEYGLLIIASTVSTYCGGILIDKHRASSNKSKWILIITLLFNLGILFIFKYFNFFNDSLKIILSKFNIFYNVPLLRILLPVGISFYTFQVISYLIDVYKGDKNAEKHLGHYAVFVAFFPKLIAGPIERAKHFLPQFYERHEFDYKRVTDGLKLISWGLFKKIVIADRLAIYVNQVYDNPAEYAGVPSLLATVFYAFQIYCDFSGYSDMAIGSGQVLGFRMTKNFDQPYYAKSLSEFWRRWHISLSSWLNDYIYTPVLIRVRDWGLFAVLFSLLVTFFICGLWHGANWTFIIWGLLHGIMLSLEVVTKKGRKKIRKMVPGILYDNISRLFTFSFVCFTYIFFRANTVSDAVLIMRNIGNFSILDQSIFIPHIQKIDILIAFLSIAIMEIVHLAQDNIQIRHFISQKGFLFRWPVYIAFVSYILFFRTSGVQFIYFQF